MLTENESQTDSSFSAIPLLSHYISQTLLEARPDLSHPLRMRPSQSMKIDRVSLKAMEIKQNNDGGSSGTLISVLDRTITSAGKRLLSDRITAPSKSIEEIESRLSLVAFFKEHTYLATEVGALLRQLDDETRLLQKMSIGRPTAEDLLLMAKSIRIQAEIKQVLMTGLKSKRVRERKEEADPAVTRRLIEDLTAHIEVADKIEASIDIKALEAQRIRDYASEVAATQAVPESVDDTEEDGVDIWNVPIEILKGKKKRTKGDSQPVEPLPVLKSGKPAPALVAWGKQEATVLRPKYVSLTDTMSVY